MLPVTAPAETAEPAGPSRGRSWFPVALLTAAVLAAIAVIALASREPGPAAQQAGREPAGQEQPPAEVPTAPAAPSVGVALGGLEDVVVDAVETDQLSEDAGRKILEEGAKANEEYSKGELDKALEHLAEAHEVVDEAVAEGQVASPEVAEAVHAAIDVVAAAMEAAPPTAAPEESDDQGEEGEGDAGVVPPGLEKKGEGEGRGKGKGKDKGDD